MKLKTNVTLGVLLLLSMNLFAQTPIQKKLEAKRITGTIKIDGLINDEVWKDAPVIREH